ncbi:hypothetical protein EVAR_11213_1 [Eumeta japonica]|uniref:Uncharacterized protein n=1 Tax=Eumeta variegata TaxID=151549 RepID=A0A4C1U4C4_EUMVA|nr:hypothetical protein EVAR_11213_1 [Eumeta japonica]
MKRPPDPPSGARTRIVNRTGCNVSPAFVNDARFTGLENKKRGRGSKRVLRCPRAERGATGPMRMIMGNGNARKNYSKLPAARAPARNPFVQAGAAPGVPAVVGVGVTYSTIFGSLNDDPDPVPASIPDPTPTKGTSNSDPAFGPGLAADCHLFTSIASHDLDSKLDPTVDYDLGPFSILSPPGSGLRFFFPSRLQFQFRYRSLFHFGES